MSRNCLVVDLDKCIGCHACEVACKNENGIALGEYWNRVLQIGPHGTFPDLEQYWLPVQCQQCEDAPCVHVCPTGASYRDADGKVLVDKEKCIGCKYCMMACPYGVRSWNAKEKAVEKCTLCGQLTSAGQEPACVAACCANARFVVRRGQSRGGRRPGQRAHAARRGQQAADALHPVREDCHVA